MILRFKLFSTNMVEDDGQEIYDLVANIVHDGDPKDGVYRIHVHHQATGMWKEIQVCLTAQKKNEKSFHFLLIVSLTQ